MSNTYSTVGGDHPVYRDDFGTDCALQSGGFSTPDAPSYQPVIVNLEQSDVS
jgi:hypothetical protein